MDFSEILSFEGGWISRQSNELIASGITLIFYFIVRIVLRKIANKYGQITHKAESRVLQMKKIINMLINVLFILLFIIIWGVKGENIILGMATAITFLGVALFAQWSIVSNVTAGVIIYFSAPFRLGDHIVLIDKDMPITAHIEDIKTFYTHLRTDKNELIVLPNNIFLQKMIAIKEGKK